MVAASSVAPPPVAPRPIDPMVAKRSLAIIAATEAPEMSDADAMDGIEFARLVGFPIEELPGDGDPHKATGLFESLGLQPDFTGMELDAPTEAQAASDAARTEENEGREEARRDGTEGVGACGYRGTQDDNKQKKKKDKK